MNGDPEIAERRRRARRTALILGLVALGFFVAIIVMVGSRG